MERGFAEQAARIERGFAEQDARIEARFNQQALTFEERFTRIETRLNVITAVLALLAASILPLSLNALLSG
jgi:hypothetical protein